MAEIGSEARRRLGPAPQIEGAPVVSIVVPNRDGVDHLRRLLAGLRERTEYPSFELIVVDNGSRDDSLDFVRRVEAPFPISIVANRHNESFSDACNQGAEQAGGELLLFLNNDVEPCEPGWLTELVGCLQRRAAGIAGATLLCPAADAEWGYRVQHRAIRLVEEDGVFEPDRRSYGADPFGEGFGEDAESPVAVGACILIERDLFHHVGGFTHGYVYGGEDIDLGMKVWAAGRSVVCSGRSLLIHRLGSTRATEDAGRQRARGEANRRLFLERWGARIRREYELDRLAGAGSWAAADDEPPPGSPSREQVLRLGFCLESSEPAPASDDDELDAMRAELEGRGHRCAILRGEAAEDPAGFEYDVAVHLRGPARYVPAPGQLNVLWITADADAVPALERDRYDLVWTDPDAAGLIDACLARAEQIGLPTRIRSDGE